MPECALLMNPRISVFIVLSVAMIVIAFRRQGKPDKIMITNTMSLAISAGRFALTMRLLYAAPDVWV